MSTITTIDLMGGTTVDTNLNNHTIDVIGPGTLDVTNLNASDVTITNGAFVDVSGNINKMTVDIGAGSTFESQGNANGATIDFGGTNATDIIGSGKNSPPDAFNNMTLGDRIEVVGTAFNGESYDALTHTMTLFENGTSVYEIQNLHLASGVVPDFHVGYDPTTGLDFLIQGPLPCFAAGTRIATARGEVAVEELRVGDLAIALEGDRHTPRPVRWVGRSTVSRKLADPVRLLPIRIRAGALAENVPVRDLLVSPGHGILIDDVLVHAGALVNGSSVVREYAAPETFLYYHVELDTHSILMTDGVPTESYLDGIEDNAFDNVAEREPPPDVEELPYPRAKSIRQIPRAILEQLALRATQLAPVTAIAA